MGLRQTVFPCAPGQGSGWEWLGRCPFLEGGERVSRESTPGFEPSASPPPYGQEEASPLPESTHRRPRRRRSSLRRSLLRVLFRTFLLTLPLWCLLALEGLVRLWDGNVLPEGRLLHLTPEGQLELLPGARARIGLPDGIRFQLKVDDQGLRLDPARASALPERGTPQITVTSSRVLRPGEESEEAIQVETPALSSLEAVASQVEATGVPASATSAPSARTATLPQVVSLASKPLAAPAEPLLLVGDEAALGWGVGDDQTFASRLSALGQPIFNAAVPAFNVEDALHRASGLLVRSGITRVWVVVNEADDYDQVYQPALARIRAVDGWLRPLVGAEAERPVPPMLGDKLHLVYHATLLSWKATASGPSSSAPGWLVDPAARLAAEEAIAEALERFADGHPGIAVGVLFVPSPLRAGEALARATPWYDELRERGLKPWEQPQPGEMLRDALRPDLEFLDLTEAVTDPDAWQAATWLSSEGHARVANALLAWPGRERALDLDEGRRPNLSESAPISAP